MEKINFDGTLLQRGFWLYIWKIKHNNKKYLYVGRTGDTSSANASSPFRRMGMHFDLKDSATANCIIKHLKNKKINPLLCSYNLLAYGPIFPEQKNMKNHKTYRDKMMSFEAELAYNVRSLGCEVLGQHPKRRQFNENVFSKIWKHFKKELNS